MRSISVSYFGRTSKRRHPYQRGRASITGFRSELRAIIETGRLVGVALPRLVVPQGIMDADCGQPRRRSAPPWDAAWRSRSGLPDADARRSSRSPTPSRSRGMDAAALSPDGCGATHPRRNSRSPTPSRSREKDAALLSPDRPRMTELLRTSRGMRSRIMPQVGCALAERTCAIPAAPMCVT